MSMTTTWHSSVFVLMLNDTREPKEWGRLHVGAVRGVSCEHVQVLDTGLFQRHWEWQEHRGEIERDWVP